MLAACAALVAIAFPAPAAAEPRGLSVSASLAGCHQAGNGTVCNLNVAFETIDGAGRYTARVTAPAGGVEDFGEVGSGSASLPVTYAGVGRYVVTISAWGNAAAGSKIARDSSR